MFHLNKVREDWKETGVILHTRVGFQSTEPGSAAPQWGSAGRTRPASGARHHPAAAGPGSTLPWLSCEARKIGGKKGQVSRLDRVKRTAMSNNDRRGPVEQHYANNIS